MPYFWPGPIKFPQDYRSGGEDMPSFWRALQSLKNPTPPRTEMICDVCGGLSSTRRCFVCANSPAGVALHLAEVEQERLRHLLAKQEGKHREELKKLSLRYAAAILDQDKVREEDWVTERLLDPQFARGFLREQKKLEQEVSQDLRSRLETIAEYVREHIWPENFREILRHLTNLST